MKNKIYGVIAVVVTSLAVLMSTSACFFFINQPEEPTCLRGE
ncbi:cyclic lactone autoinducer peptide [Acetobacterium bakii]|uniref:Cyclic lactone autoinducer peptide n=1 Tax=Acetobacterium bakii TaxID=52689 RepID=A0A0L6TZS6_9FIRM|nr:cyclic lactone autoinducer peptide [Acetobacterium bakii]KNZ41766.1 cyclic lactone autoinducer peptide [Acetobacterium bakii]